MWSTMEQYQFSTTLCKEDPSNQMFPKSLGDSYLIFQRPIGDVEKLAEVLAQLPNYLLGAEGEALVILESGAQDAKFSEDWPLVDFIYHQFLLIVHTKHKENTLPPDVWVFLNLFAAIPLTDVYHFKLKNPSDAHGVITAIQRICATRKNRSGLSPDLVSAFKSRILSYEFEMERKKFGSSPEKHAEHLKETLIKYTNSEFSQNFTDVDGAPDPMRSKLHPWVSDMRTCASLFLLWYKEFQPEAAIYWMQLCKTLQRKFKEYCPRIGNPLELKGTALLHAEVFFVIEVRTSCHEAECYTQMGKVGESIDILLDTKNNVNGVWMDILDERAPALLLEVNNKLLITYSAIGSGHDGRFDAAHLEQQRYNIKEEISDLQDVIEAEKMRAEDFPIKMLKMKAVWSPGDVTSKERADMFEACLREVRPLLSSKTELPRAAYMKHAMECLLFLGQNRRMQEIEPGQSELTQVLRACQHFEEALELAYEAPDVSFVIYALDALGSACLCVFRLKCESATPRFVLNRNSGALEQFSGSWLTSEKGPLANVTWNAYHPIELQLVEKLSSLQIAKQAEILYAVNDLHDEWSHRMNEWSFSDVYVNQQHACSCMIVGLIHNGDYSERQEPDTSLEQIVEQLGRHGYSEQEIGDRLNLVEELLKRQILSSERGRTRTLVYQLGPGYLSSETVHALKRFDSDDQLAWDAIQNGQLACGERTVCVEYSYNVQEADLRGNDPIGPIYAYVVLRPVSRGAEECQIASEIILDCTPNGLKSFLDDLHSIMSGIDLRNSETGKQDEASTTENEYNEAAVITQLEVLYDLFILPIAKFLPQFPEQNVIFAPQGVLANVPFGLLRNPETKQFLFERHIISLAPSLRVLGFCKQRYLYLKDLRLVDDTTPVLLVGNPAYSNEDHRLRGSETEMNAIAGVFQHKPGRCVGILKGFDASVSAVLDLAENPSKSNRTQACIHFAVHGHVSENHPKGALEFTDPPSSTSSTLGVEDASISADHKYSPWTKDDRGKEKIYEGMMEAEIGTLTLSSDGGSSSGSKDDFSDVGGSSASSATNNSVISSSRAGSDGNISTRTHETNVFGEVGGVRKNRTGDSLPGDKFLRSEDIIRSGIDWRAFVVVLSACNTSRGQVISEGVLNLPRAFLVAGIPCIVMSLWKTDDKCSHMFMREFYTHMKEGDYVASALRKAMLTMMRTGMEIYKWAPFAVWGFPIVYLPPQLVDRLY